jgi:hypothetical protein
VFRGIARTLELDRVGVRRTWTVRRPHGVYTIVLRQTPFGDRILLDGMEIARAEPWKYEGAVRFKVEGAPAEVRFVTDTTAGTMSTELFVDDEKVLPDAGSIAPAPSVSWAPRLERVAYALGGTLIFGGLVGSPVFDAVRQAFWTAAVVLLLAGLRALDPFGVITVAFDKMVEDRLSMIVAGTEVVLIAAIARGRWGLGRHIPFVRERSRLPRALGWTAIALIAFLILALS